MQERTGQEVSNDEFDLDISFVEEKEDTSQKLIEFVSCSAFSCANQRTCNSVTRCEACA